MNPSRVLIVDDQRQVSQVLKSTLELSGREYIISEVTSAEEALAEMSRAPIDLLVTDLRLPTMSGLELVEQAQENNPELQTIMISGNPTQEIRMRAEQLGVVAFLPKPIATNAFIEVVEAALEVAEDQAAAEEQRAMEEVEARLEDLRNQIGAEAVYLLQADGETLATSGQADGLHLDTMFQALLEAHRASVGVSQSLGAADAQSFHHYDGKDYNLYLTNLGQAGALVIVHGGSQATGQLGAVMHYGRKAALDIAAQLGESASASDPEVPANDMWEELMSEEENKDLDPDELEAAAEELDADGAEDFWEEASETSMKPDGAEDSLTYDQAQELGLLEDE